MAVAKSRWLLKIGHGIGGAFRTSNRSVMINDNRSVAVIVGSAHVDGKKSTVLEIRTAFVSLMKHLKFRKCFMDGPT